MSRKTANIAAALTAILIFGGVMYYSSSAGKSKKADFSQGDIVLDFEASGRQEAKAAAPDASWQAFTSADPAFSFRYPAGYRMGEFAENGGKVVLIQGDAKTLMQVYAAPYSDSPVITADIIRRDLPELSIREPKEIRVLSGSGLTFLSDNSLSEPTREIWFVKSGFLYQVSIPLGNEALASNIIETMKFGN